jgi:enoyl-[acyl-carrier protein] reductase I
MGVANERSLAWGVAKSLFKVGANLIFTYRKDRSLGKLNKLLSDHNFEAKLIVQCDVNSDESIKDTFFKIGEEIDHIHGIVHSIAFAQSEDLKGNFIETSRSGYAFAQDTSAYSLIAIAREAKPLMTKGGSILGKSNIRVNAISAGAIRILAAKGIPFFNEILNLIEETSPLKRNVSQEEVGDMTLALLSHLSRGVTGGIVYVDAGYNIMG